jgi:hypothetical protein
VWVRRLTDQEGQKLQQIVRRGSTRPTVCRRLAGRPEPSRGTLIASSRTFCRTHGVTYYHGCLSAHTGADIRRWAKKNKVELCFTPTYASWADPIEAHFGPLRQFTLANSHHRSHTVQTRALQRYLRWRNTNARHPDVLAAQRRERARIRSERGTRWGGRPLVSAA